MFTAYAMATRTSTHYWIEFVRRQSIRLPCGMRPPIVVRRPSCRVAPDPERAYRLSATCRVLSVLFGELFCFGAQRGCEVDFTTVQNDLAGFDACFNCLGTSAFRMSETEYRRVSYDFPLAAARALLIANPDLVLTYVSGVGTDGTGTTRMMWHASRARRRTRCWRCHHAPTCSAPRSSFHCPAPHRRMRCTSCCTRCSARFIPCCGELRHATSPLACNWVRR